MSNLSQLIVSAHTYRTAFLLSLLVLPPTLRSNLYTLLYIVVLGILLLLSLLLFVSSVAQTSCDLSFYMPAYQTLVSSKSPLVPSSIHLLDLVNPYLLRFLNRNYQALNPRILHHCNDLPEQAFTLYSCMFACVE